MDIKDQTVIRTIWVLHCAHPRAIVISKGGQVRPAVTRHQDSVTRSCVSNSSDQLLNGIDPLLSIDIMRFVHQTKDDVFLTHIMFGEFGPEIYQGIYSDCALSHYLPVVPRILSSGERKTWRKKLRIVLGFKMW